MIKMTLNELIELMDPRGTGILITAKVGKRLTCDIAVSMANGDELEEAQMAYGDKRVTGVRGTSGGYMAVTLE